jgi:hypothetical protein
MKCGHLRQRSGEKTKPPTINNSMYSERGEERRKSSIGGKRKKNNGLWIS